jgi:alginate O-acetyltransferase complex protein AlgI
VLWGLYYGVLLLFERLVIGKRIERVPPLLRWLETFVLVNIGWVFFYIPDPPLILEKLRRMFIYMPTDWRALLALDASVCSKALSLPFALLFSFPIVKKAAAPEKGPGLIVLNGTHVVLFIVCIVFIISSSFTPFVYFNF